MKYKRIENLDEALKGPAFILKHSAVCPISMGAKERVDEFMKDSEFDFYLVIVQEQRDVSNEIESKLDVVHESPQLLFVENGTALFVFNHGAINIENIKEALASRK